MEVAYLLLGSNLADRAELLNQAVALIAARAGSIWSYSSVYETEPWEASPDLPFLNMAVSIETDHNPYQLIDILLAIESELGRERDGSFNAPRTIDIDILLFGNLIVDEPVLQVPHPRMHLRRFALLPLNEIARDVVHPKMGKTVSGLLEECGDKLSVEIYKPLESLALDDEL